MVPDIDDQMSNSDGNQEVSGWGGVPGLPFPSPCNRKVPLLWDLPVPGNPVGRWGGLFLPQSHFSPSLTHWVLSPFLLFSFHMIHLSLFSLLPVPALEKVLG